MPDSKTECHCEDHCYERNFLACICYSLHQGEDDSNIFVPCRLVRCVCHIMQITPAKQLNFPFCLNQVKLETNRLVFIDIESYMGVKLIRM